MCMSAPSIPTPPAPPPPPATPPDLKSPEVNQARLDQTKKNKQAMGYASTILTSAMGAQGELANASSSGKSLASLGG